MTKFAVAKLQSCSKSFLHWCESDRTEFCCYLADTRSFASPAIMVIGPIVMSTSLFLFRANHTFKSPLLSSLHCFQLNRHNSQAHTYNYGAMNVHCVTIHQNRGVINGWTFSTSQTSRTSCNSVRKRVSLTQFANGQYFSRPSNRGIARFLSFVRKSIEHHKSCS